MRTLAECGVRLKEHRHESVPGGRGNVIGKGSKEATVMAVCLPVPRQGLPADRQWRLQPAGSKAKETGASFRFAAVNRFISGNRDWNYDRLY